MTYQTLRYKLILQKGHKVENTFIKMSKLT